MSGSGDVLAGSRDRPRRRIAAQTSIAAAAIALSGCTSAAVGSAPAPAETAIAADCLAPQVVQSLGLVLDPSATATPHPDVPAAGSVPEGFAPSAAIQCLAGETLTDVVGVWDAVTVRRLEGDLAGLVDALARPSMSPNPSGCADSPGADPVGEVWLIDAMGRAIRAAVPLDGCGRGRPEVAAVIDRLDEVEATHYPVRLSRARLATDQVGHADQSP
ncbi:hypothetical protein [Cellulomonas chengniuliangii]|uniref:hypothetical protein n=1 Tax=Cellulomonas chengniuliangii TaxID=2968084 RepID=UPI001D0DE559|nr:hypothetical protein [Cellulomonas chengniuliangii]MCC2318963.1 hypothetical protein [Cellulomonas chengniuliangii]